MVDRNIVPSVVERELIDIELSGVDEDIRSESVDWTKFWTVAENVVQDSPLCFSVRPGIERLRADSDINSTAVSPIRRLGSLAEGLVFVGKNFNLYKYIEVADVYVSSGRLPEFSVTSKPVAGSHSNNTFGSLNRIQGVAKFTKYHVVAYANKCPAGIDVAEGTLTNIVVSDAKSNLCVKKYTISGGVIMVGVDDRYLHFYDVSGGVARFWQIDTESLPAGPGLSPTTTNLTGSPVSVRSAVPISGGSVAVSSGSTTRIEKFNTAGTSALSGSFTGFTNGAFGIDTDGTNFYVSGNDGTNFMFKVLNSSFTVTRTVTGNTLAGSPSAGGVIRIAVRPSDAEVRLVAYGDESVVHIWKADSDDTAFTRVGWLKHAFEGSLPYWHQTSGRFYLEVITLSGGLFAVPDEMLAIANSSVVIDITDTTKTDSVDTDTFTYRFRPCAVLDTYNAPTTAATHSLTSNNGTAGNCYRPYVSGYDSMHANISWRRSATHAEFAISAEFLKLYDPSGVSFTSQECSGGVGCMIDNHTASELGFLQVPNVQAGSAAGALAAGSYSLVGLWSYTDSSGRRVFSRVSVPEVVVLGGVGSITATITLPTISAKQGVITAHVFRTTSGGTQYFELWRRDIGSGTATTAAQTTITVTADATTDVTLLTKPALHRQPGTANTPLDRYNPLASKHMTRHKDRVFYCRNDVVYYSSFDVIGEAPWFNPAFSFAVPGGVGDITGLASMDGVLVIFKRDSVFIVDGDGPPENGGDGTEFSPPRRLNTQFGCIDPRSIVNVPYGVMYRSTRGIELLQKNSQVLFVGAQVRSTTTANPYTGGSALDKVNSRAVWVLGSALSSDGTLDSTASGTTIVFDIETKKWTTAKHTNSTGTYGRAMQDVVFARINSTDSDLLLWGDAGFVYSESETTKLDHDQFIPVIMTTGWVKGPSKQERVRVSDLFVLGSNISPHKLKVSYATDYNPTMTVLKTFDDNVLTALNPEQVSVQPTKEAVQSMQFKIETVAPTVGAIGNGRQLDFLGVTVRAGPRGGGAKLAATSKG